MIFLDTNICIAAIRENPRVAARLIQHGGRVHLPFPVVAELRFGVEKMALAGRLSANARPQLDAFLARIAGVVAVTDAMLSAHARVRAQLEATGNLIGPNDLWIAAQALAEDALLVSDKVREFKRVPGLRLENWLR